MMKKAKENERFNQVMGIIVLTAIGFFFGWMSAPAEKEIHEVEFHEYANPPEMVPWETRRFLYHLGEEAGELRESELMLQINKDDRASVEQEGVEKGRKLGFKAGWEAGYSEGRAREGK